MFHFWRNTLRQGGPAMMTGRFSTGTTMKQVNLDTAPSFATMLISEDRDMRELFTAQQDTCPVYSVSTGNITKADCFVNNGATMAQPGSNVPAANQAGILTNPGFLAQYYSNEIRASRAPMISRTSAFG